MKLEVLPDAAAVARRAAEVVAVAARAAVAARGHCALAFSGGHTPGQMLRELAREDVPWHEVHVFQVDERVAPDDDTDRNLTQLARCLLLYVPLPREHLHAMPVGLVDLERGAADYARSLQKVAGVPAVLDLVHLGLGPDGHTASLVPGDRALEVTDRDVALTGSYQGRQRMTLTFPALDRARQLLWLVTGSDKAPALARLQRGDTSLPAGRVRSEHAHILADAAAAAVPAKR